VAVESQAADERLGIKTGVKTDEFFSVEVRGIDVIPLEDRHGRPRELFFIWMASNLIFGYVIIGAIAGSLGLSFGAAILALILGNVFWVFVGVLSLTGPRTGTSTMVTSRAALGWRGNVPVAFLNWFIFVGFGVVNAALGTLAVIQIASELGIHESTLLKIVSMAIALGVTIVVAVLGHATLVVLQRWFTYGLVVGTAILAVFVISKLDLGAPRAPLAADNLTGAWLLAFFLFAAFGPYSFYTVPADYTRYLHPDTPRKPIVFWTVLGSVIPAVLLGFVGLAAATAADMTDPIGGLSGLAPGWFLIPFLLIVLGGAITNNITGLYSSGLNLQTMGIRLARSRSVFVDATLITAGTIYALFISDFTVTLTNYLSLMVIWIAPWAGIFLTDMLLRRSSYDPAGLHQIHEGPYRYWNGWNFRGLLALATGIVTGGAFSHSALYKGPLVDAIGGGDLSVFVGFIVGSIVYYFLMRSEIERQQGLLGPHEKELKARETAEL
jgi:nucleobase:cation symporter-1, NCS1 family